MALKSSIDLLVVGAGPVGLTAALAARHGGAQRIEIVDQAARRTGLSYALALHPSTLAGLEPLGVVPSLLSRGRRVERIGLYDGAKRRHDVDLSRLDGPFPFVLVLPQSELEAALLDALAAAAVKVRWNHRLARLDANSDAAVAAMIERSEAEPGGYAVAGSGAGVEASFEREVPFVIGADGHASLVRRLLGIEREALAPAGRVAVFEFESDDSPPGRDELRLGFVDGLRSVRWPLPRGRIRFGFELGEGDGDDFTNVRDKSRQPAIVPWLATPLDASRWRALTSERMPWHDETVGRLMWSSTVRFERASATRYGRGRAWLAGDAAHLAFPFGVTSMNAGLLEACGLASRIGRALDGSGSVAELEAFGAMMRETWHANLAAAAAGGDLDDPWLTAHAPRILEALPLAASSAAALLARSRPAGGRGVG